MKINKGLWSVKVIFVSLGVFFLVETFMLALSKFFTIDEFQYAHAAWLCAQGMVPYRDFFDHHFPFLYQLFAVIFYFGGNDPLLIIWLRGLMLLFLGMTLLGISIVNWRFSEKYNSSILSIVFLLSCWPYITRSVEIRPDGVAFALFITAIAILCIRDNAINDPPVKKCLFPFIAGLAMALAIWSSQKVVVYGFPVFIYLFYCFICEYRTKPGNKKPLLFSELLGFVCGGSAVFLVVFGYLIVTGSLGNFWNFCIVMPSQLQEHFRGFSWTVHFFPGFIGCLWAFPLFWAGIVGSIKKFRLNHDYFEILLISLPLTSFFSYFLQKAPYDYSLIPFYGTYWIFAGRGGSVIFETIENSGKLNGKLKYLISSLFVMVLVAAVMLNIRTIEKFRADNNQYQLAVLKTIKQATDEHEVFFDNTGNFVARPHAYFYYFNCKYMRENMGDQLADEILGAIKDNECAWLFLDYRMNELPVKVKRFILDNYVRYSADLLVWGREFEPGHRKTSFFAVKDGSYFISTDRELPKLKLEINGQAVNSRVLNLRKGPNQVRYNSSDNFYLIYLPANGEMFRPKKTAQSTFVR